MLCFSYQCYDLKLESYINTSLGWTGLSRSIGNFRVHFCKDITSDKQSQPKKPFHLWFIFLFTLKSFSEYWSKSPATKKVRLYFARFYLFSFYIVRYERVQCILYLQVKRSFIEKAMLKLLNRLWRPTIKRVPAGTVKKCGYMQLFLPWLLNMEIALWSSWG